MIFTPNGFLKIGGIILVLVGILGMTDVLMAFSSTEQWIHLLVGIVCLIASFTLSASAQKILAMIVGIIGILTAIYSLFTPNYTALAVYLIVGAWALIAGFKKPAMLTMNPSMPA